MIAKWNIMENGRDFVVWSEWKRNIKERGSYKTKPLDGILVHIALKRLRSEFPDKYVAVKTNQKGDKYVLVNKYRSSKDKQARKQ